MDPNACYQRYLRLYRYLGGNAADIKEAVDVLTKWINDGGFEPTWTSEQRHAFLTGKPPPEAVKSITMARSRAAKILDDIRAKLASGIESAAIERHLANQYGIEPLQRCDGEAHQVGEGRANGNIDNCMCCAPRWGVVGPTIRVT